MSDGGFGGYPPTPLPSIEKILLREGEVALSFARPLRVRVRNVKSLDQRESEVANSKTKRRGIS